MRKFIHAIALLLTLSLSAPVLAGPFEDGLTAYNKSDYTTALRLWRPLAEQGNARAQFNLGIMYDNGQGVPQDDAQAVKWYRLAADQGNANAQYNLGVMYDNGQGVPQDYAQAVKLKGHRARGTREGCPAATFICNALYQRLPIWSRIRPAHRATRVSFFRPLSNTVIDG